MLRRIQLNFLVKILLTLLILLMTVSIARPQSKTQQPGVFRNPLTILDGADPWLTYYEGNYYLSTTTWTSELTMRKSPTLAGLKTAEPIPIYFETNPLRCCKMWAPEFHLLEGPNGLRWYFYYTAGSFDSYDYQRSYVLESAGTDPLGPYTFKGKLSAPSSDGFSLDGSVLQLDDALYFLSGDGEGEVVIAPMSNPWTLSGAHVVIAKPIYPWEKVDGEVNQGPMALYHDDKTFIVYSASACWSPDYTLGLLTYKGNNPLSADSWAKNAKPVFQRSDENGVFAPGHNGTFKSPDGTEDWIVYHANDSLSTVGCDGQRTTRAQKFTWNADGSPNFGIPVSTAEEIAVPSGDTGIDPLPEFPPLQISRFKSLSVDKAYLFLNTGDFTVHVDSPPEWLPDSQFVVVPGLADPTAISFKSIEVPGFFLRIQNDKIVFRPTDTTASFAKDATWWLRPGLADENGVSFESYSQPGSYISKHPSGATLIKLTDTITSQVRSDATFLEEH
jgi:GH43 family beta-xylosidase